MNDTDLALYTMELAEPNRMIFVGYQTKDGNYHIHCPNFINKVDNKLYWKDDRGDYCTRTDYSLLTDVRDCKKENKLDTIISLLTSINQKLSTNTVHFTPTLYSTSWYVEPRGYEGTEQYLGIFSDDVKNAPQEIIVKREGLVDKVTGYITEEGKVVYYCQYE